MVKVDILFRDDRLSQFLASLKLESSCDVNCLNGNEAPHRTAFQSHVLLFFCDESLNSSELSCLLGKRPFLREYLLKVCVFCSPISSINKALGDFFEDFIFLPCAHEEFVARLALLTDQLIVDNSTPHLSELEDFAEFNLKGNSTVFNETLLLIKQVARCDATVLIEGETGTGKENVARSIHYLSPRRDAAFVPLNCGAIPDNLFESELFGYEKGAFTDARNSQEGLVSLVNHGTLFLDEVDSLSNKAQTALLRFLQTGEFRPLGGKVTKFSDVRVVAATNANLCELVKSGAMREDLYFRLNVLYIHMPPLRERPDDIEVIANFLLERYLSQYGKGPKSIHPMTMRWLKNQQWPGNVRELENVLLRAFLLHGTPELMIDAQIHPDYDGIEIKSTSTEPETFQHAKQAAINDFEKNYVQRMLAITTGNVSQAARLAGKERRAFGKLLKKYNIETAKFKDNARGVESKSFP